MAASVELLPVVVGAAVVVCRMNEPVLPVQVQKARPYAIAGDSLVKRKSGIATEAKNNSLEIKTLTISRPSRRRTVVHPSK